MNRCTHYLFQYDNCSITTETPLTLHLVDGIPRRKRTVDEELYEEYDAIGIQEGDEDGEEALVLDKSVFSKQHHPTIISQRTIDAIGRS